MTSTHLHPILEAKYSISVDMGVAAVDTCSYEELEHTSEVGIRVHARTAATLYSCAARAMFALLRSRPDPESDILSRRVSLESVDAECLMVDWLSELLYWHETAGVILTHCQVRSHGPTRLEAVIEGRRPASLPTQHIKAVTFHQLSISQSDAGWSAVVFFDI